MSFIQNLLLSYGNGCDQRSFKCSGTASASGFVAAVARCLPFHLNRNRYVAGSSPSVAYLMGAVRSDLPVVPTLSLFRQTLSLSFHIFSFSFRAVSYNRPILNMRIGMGESELKKNNDAVKRWLRRYREAKLDARRIREEYAELLSLQEAIRAIRYDGQPGGSDKHDLSDLFVARDSMERHMNTANAKVVCCYEQITKAISMLDYQTEKDVMSARYVRLKDGYDYYSMKEIGDQLHYSERYTQTIHGLALRNLEPIIRKIDKQGLTF